MAVRVARLGDLTASVFAGEAVAGVEQLPLLVAQGAAVTVLALAPVGLAVQRDALPVDTPGGRARLSQSSGRTVSLAVCQSIIGLSFGHSQSVSQLGSQTDSQPVGQSICQSIVRQSFGPHIHPARLTRELVG